MKSEEIIKIAELIYKRRVMEQLLSVDEEILLKNWLAKSDKNQDYYDKFDVTLRLVDFNTTVSETNQCTQWERLNKAISQPQRKLIPIWIGYAAGVVMLLTVFTLWMTISKKDSGAIYVSNSSENIAPVMNKAVLILADGKTVDLDGVRKTFEEEGSLVTIFGGEVKYENTDDEEQIDPIFNTIMVPRQGIFKIELNDGTKVFLNSESELRYPLRFNSDVREVELHGEAWFEAAYDPDKPFIVKSGNAKIKVLGTSFIVSAYNDEPIFKTSLLSGAVEVCSGDGELCKTLASGQRAVWTGDGKDMKVESFNVKHYKQFTDGLIVFEEEELSVIMRMLSRWFDIDVVYNIDMSKKYSITGKFSRDDNLYDILTLITRLGAPNFRVESRTIYVE